MMVFAISLGGSLIVHFIPPEEEVKTLVYKFFLFVEYEFSLVMFGLMFASFFKNSKVRQPSLKYINENVKHVCC